MRPLRLEAEGFTCYRDRQEPLDFSGLSLFAIAGPTGAGKSSILDAMLYALYGEVPRIGKQGMSEFISHGRDALSVLFEFGLRGSVYRITRRMKRGKKGTLTTSVTLAEVTAGGERHLADNVRPVQETLAGLLKLDYRAFTQTVILPQGEFARFLRAEPKEQRSILQQLLRHDVFQRMRDEAEKRRIVLDADLRARDREIEQYALATQEALTQTTADLASAREALARATADRATHERELQDIRERRRRTEEWLRLTADIDRIDREEPVMAQVREELALAQRAAVIASRLEAEHAARERLQARTRERDAAELEVEALSRRRSDAERTAQAAAQAAEGCLELRERIRRIDEIRGDIVRRQALTARLPGLATDVRAAQHEAAHAGARLLVSQQALERSRRAVERAQADLDATFYSEAEEGLLAELWTDITLARTVDAEIAGLQGEQQQAAQALASLRSDEARVQRLEEDAAAAAGTAADAAKDAAVAYAEAQERHQAAALRAHLHDGTECPVCLQTVAHVPRVAAPPELRTLERARDAAEARLTTAMRAAQDAREALLQARADVEYAAASLDSLSSRIMERMAGRDALLAGVLTSLATTAPVADPSGVLAWADIRRSELQGLKAAHGRAAAALRPAETAVTSARMQVMAAEAACGAADAELARVSGDERRCREDLEEVNARIAAVSVHADPAMERAELAARVQELERRKHEADAARADVSQNLAAASARLAAAATAVTDAARDADQQDAGLRAALTDAGFLDGAAAAAARRSPRQLTDLEASVRTHDQARATALHRLSEVEPTIAGREVDAAGLEAAERRYTQVDEACRGAQAVVSSLEHEHAALERAVERRATLRAERELLAGRLGVTAQMAADLRGDGFQEYLLEEAFRGLVTGASVRMREISNRYTLDWEAGDFYVVDHDNAGERRRAETLSGGETFIASLCLALQLSDEVLRTSGALQMDSLFVDEGFGTLDAQSLSEVTDAMEALRQDGGRLIGVISHRPELTERLPGCIRIEKEAGESRWRLERVG